MKKFLLILICGLFATLQAQLDTVPDFSDYLNANGGVERPLNEYNAKIKKHYIDKGSKVYALIWVVHKNESVDTIIKSKCIYKKTIKSDTLYTTNLRNTSYVFGDVADSANGHR